MVYIQRIQPIYNCIQQYERYEQYKIINHVAMAFSSMHQSVKILNVNRTPGQPKKRKKITLVFDEEKRREFLGGFRKRNLEKRKKAQEELQRKLKEERKRIKQEAKEQMKKWLSNRDIPELENLLSQKEYETEGHTVSILELNVADLAEGGKWIGENKAVEEENEVESFSESSEQEDEDEIVGMSMNEKEKKVPEDSASKQFNSKKDLKREIKHAAVKKIQKSKVFQKIQGLERSKSKKENRRKLRAKTKLLQKRSKKHGNKQKPGKHESKFKKKGRR